MSQKTPRKNEKGYFGKILFHDFVIATAVLPTLLIYRPRWIYENGDKKKVKKGAVFIANHAGHFDPIYMMIAVPYRRHHFLTMKELFSTKFRAWLFDMFFCIPVDRENFRLKTFREVVARLKKEQAITMFPEGRVSKEEMATFKSGMVLMAMTADRPIVPVYVKPRKSKWERLTVVIGEPIDLKERYGAIKMSDMDRVAADIKEREEKLQQLCEKRKKGE